jgi:dipeptidyl aminopeptidase/acylaminoacyl peptidase
MTVPAPDTATAPTRPLLRPVDVPVTPAAVLPHPGGRPVDGSYSNAAGTRGYKLYLPSGYAGQAVPLIVMLHGGTQTAVDFAELVRFFNQHLRQPV